VSVAVQADLRMAVTERDTDLIEKPFNSSGLSNGPDSFPETEFENIPMQQLNDEPLAKDRGSLCGVWSAGSCLPQFLVILVEFFQECWLYALENTNLPSLNGVGLSGFMLVVIWYNLRNIWGYQDIPEGFQYQK
jgi:hypothetical protein